MSNDTVSVFKSHDAFAPIFLSLNTVRGYRVMRAYE